MSVIFFIEFFLLNTEVLAKKIGCLANSTKNVLYCAVLLSAVFYSRLRLLLPAAWAILILCSYGGAAVVPALTNTLFTIHPPLLYVTIFLSIAGLLQGRRGLSLKYLSIAWVSMFMGGFWSLQELSWGGWWNWDVLECGVGYLWCLATYASHKSLRSRSVRLVLGALLIAATSMYTLLNKLGVGVSIHAFISSASAQRHYAEIVLVLVQSLLALAYPRPYLLSYAITLLLALYFGLKTGVFLKPVLMYSSALAFWWLFSKKSTIKVSHSCFCSIVSVLFLANCWNSSLFYNFRLITNVLSVICSSPFYYVDVRSQFTHKLVWSDIWLSKPRYSYGRSFESVSSRNISLRSSFSSFCK